MRILTTRPSVIRWYHELFLLHFENQNLYFYKPCPHIILNLKSNSLFQAEWNIVFTFPKQAVQSEIKTGVIIIVISNNNNTNNDDNNNNNN